MKTIALLVPLIFLLSSCATEQRGLSPLGLSPVNKTTTIRTSGDEKIVIHPAPSKPHFLSVDRYEAVSKTVAPFPAPSTYEQRADEMNLLTLQQLRTPADCSRAASEVRVSLAAFYGTPNGPLSASDVERLSPFFEQVRNDADHFIQKLKVERGRKRPFLYIHGLNPCVAREVTPAYPSGHATLARLYALILSDMYPSQTKVLLKRADQIGDDRVVAGMHHRTDIIAGQALGERLYKEFSKSPTFRKELAALEHGRTKVAR
jgi:acid phosphatase (class A)